MYIQSSINLIAESRKSACNSWRSCIEGKSRKKDRFQICYHNCSVLLNKSHSKGMHLFNWYLFFAHCLINQLLFNLLNLYKFETSRLIQAFWDIPEYLFERHNTRMIQVHLLPVFGYISRHAVGRVENTRRRCATHEDCARGKCRNANDAARAPIQVARIRPAPT